MQFFNCDSTACLKWIAIVHGDLSDMFQIIVQSFCDIIIHLFIVLPAAVIKNKSHCGRHSLRNLHLKSEYVKTQHPFLQSNFLEGSLCLQF